MIASKESFAMRLQRLGRFMTISENLVASMEYYMACVSAIVAYFVEDS